MRDEQYVQVVGENNKKGELVSLGVGDIIIDSAADESCWPVEQGDAFPTLSSNRKMVLKTANGGDMEHYGQKEILFKCNSGEGKELIGLTFQVTDVNVNPLDRHQLQKIKYKRQNLRRKRHLPERAMFGRRADTNVPSADRRVPPTRFLADNVAKCDKAECRHCAQNIMYQKTTF